jgi:predicted kinase
MESSAAGLGTVAAGKSEKVRKQALRRYALKLKALRDTLAELEAQEAGQALQKSKAATEVTTRVDLDDEPTVIKMSEKEFRDRFNVEVGKGKGKVA